MSSSFAVFGFILLFFFFNFGTPVFASDMPDAEKGKVLKVIDGDTVIVRIGKVIERIRLIGVDAPELIDPRLSVAQCYSKNAREHLKRLIGSNEVLLVRDGRTKNRDTYGRLLRYVYLVGDGSQVVNALLIQNGFARAYTRFPFERAHEFQQYQKTAQTLKSGLWNKATCNGKKSR